VEKRTRAIVKMEINLIAIKSTASSPSRCTSRGPILRTTVWPDRKGRVRTRASRKKEGKRNRLRMKEAGSLEIT
jgi:hypothetical protein